MAEAAVKTVENAAPAAPNAAVNGARHAALGEAALDHLALRRELIRVEDHLADIEGRLLKLRPLLQAVALLRNAFGVIVGVLLSCLKCASLIWHWRSTLKRVDDARFRSERLVFDPERRRWTRQVDPAAFRGHLRRSFGLFHPPLYTVELRQRVGLARRPRVLHAIANVWVGGSTQLIADLHDYLGHRIEMEVLTSSLPPYGTHRGMTIRLAPQPASRHVVRSAFGRFRPDIVHIHYWGDVDEAWYRTVFEIAAEYGCPVIQNINTPVAPFPDISVACNVFVSQSVLDRFGSDVPARVIHPGIDLERFAPRKPDPDAFESIGAVYRLENDKLNADAVELFIEIAKRRPATRVVIVGDGSLFDHFRARVEQEGLLPQFEFAGFVPYEELPGYLARFRIFVAPVRQESFGQVIPFAMCAGLAVAGYRIGAIPEILESENTLDDTLEGTANIITSLLDDPVRIEALGQHNRAIAIERFSVERMAINYSELYQAVAPREFDLLRGFPDAICFPL